MKEKINTSNVRSEMKSVHLCLVLIEYKNREQFINRFDFALAYFIINLEVLKQIILRVCSRCNIMRCLRIAHWRFHYFFYLIELRRVTSLLRMFLSLSK